MPPVDTPAKPAIEDDYGIMEACKQVFRVPSFTLESGVTLDDVHVNYKTFGVLNAAKDNVLFVCHALTGNAALDTWWGGLLGDGKPFDTSKYLVVCANILGSCYGTTGPTSINPHTGKRYGGSFPDVTVRDTVRLHIRLVVDEIGASEVACVVGGSLGGMQTLEWGFLGQGLVQKIAVIACGAQHSGWQIGISEVQRQAIYRVHLEKMSHRCYIVLLLNIWTFVLSFQIYQSIFCAEFCMEKGRTCRAWNHRIRPHTNSMFPAI
ncbi:homoserine O-acetyltransferase, variant [Aphanomyces astaci]|uniref:Homoserine O-acetyltransferase, variant n=1 Tax=Aphanomyces astaci TaxID=112090 RepID=W4G807_APHAT|nr:homoserine O-acetyltransferase, variant [Aphanomyces astaci]ETV75810.1 homoserine O-acetyltransferase, variant [Aphanomyces astaci]|eukprot:XP_009834941.1 homoserine O-acetyltransferase, variant [Aphanomyces astaci]